MSEFKIDSINGYKFLPKFSLASIGNWVGIFSIELYNIPSLQLSTSNTISEFSGLNTKNGLSIVVKCDIKSIEPLKSQVTSLIANSFGF